MNETGVNSADDARANPAADPARRGAVRPRLARPLFDRRLDLPGRAAGRGGAARRAGSRARGRRRARRQNPAAGARRRHVAMRPDGRAGAGRRRREIPARGGGLRQGAGRGHRAAGRRARPAERLAEAARPVVPGRRLDLGTVHPGRHGRQQFLRQPLDPLRQHGAQRRLDRRHPGERAARALRRRPAGGHGAGGAGARRSGGGAGLRRAGRDRVHVPQGSATGRRLQPRHLLPAVAASLHPRQLGEPRAPPGRQRGHPGGDRAAHAQALAAARAQSAGRGQLPELLQGDGCGATHRQAQADGGRAGRPHDDRAGARQPRLPAGDRAGADRAAGGDPAGRVRRRRARAAAQRSAAAGRADGRSRLAGQRGRDAGAAPAGRAVGGAQGRAEHHDVDEGRR